MHIITAENCEELDQAYRDVLAMYVEIARERGRLSDANIWVRFDPLKFVDAEGDGEFHYGDIAVVNAGSALAILCDFYDRYEEERPLLDERTERFAAAIRQGRLSSYSDIAAIVMEAIERENADTLWPWFSDSVQAICQKYVRAYIAGVASIPPLNPTTRSFWQRLKRH